MPIVVVSKLSDVMLDWAVAQIEGDKLVQIVEDGQGRLPYVFDLHLDIKHIYEVESILAGEPGQCDLGPIGLKEWMTDFGYYHKVPISKPYSSSWSHCGPIIERENIDIRRNWPEANRLGHLEERKWFSEIVNPDYFCSFGPTNLIAAMRVYVLSKLGKEIEIPEGLCIQLKRVKK